eukprot:766355-Hanusia_phi.AAC.6
MLQDWAGDEELRREGGRERKKKEPNQLETRYIHAFKQSFKKNGDFSVCVVIESMKLSYFWVDLDGENG